MSIPEASLGGGAPPVARSEQRGTENAILKYFPTVRDRAATLECHVARLNAVNPDFTVVDKSMASLLVATRWLTKAFDTGIDSASKKEAYRRELTLEFAYRTVLDLERGIPIIHEGRAIEPFIEKSMDRIKDAYNRMHDLYSMYPQEIEIFRGLWLYTALALRKCAIQPYRHKLGRKVFDLRVEGALDDNDTYYLARVLDSRTAASEPRYHINSPVFRALKSDFDEVLTDLDKVIEAMRKYRRTPDLQTIEKRDRLVAVFKLIADKLRLMEVAAREAFRKRPIAFWVPEDILEIDPYDTRYQ